MRAETRLALVFAAGALVAAMGAQGHLVLWWPALSLALVSASYAGIGPRLFGKSTLGRVHPVSLLVFAPYLVVSWCVMLLLRSLRREAPYHEVRPGLFLGRLPIGTRELPPSASLVVDLTTEFPRMTSNAAYVCVPTLDGSVPRDVDAVRAVVDQIRAHDGVVYVHCAAGHGRSAAVVAAVLVSEGRAPNAIEALRSIRRQRRGVGLTRSQLALVYEACR